MTGQSVGKGGIAIDILVLADRLEELFQKGSRVPLTRRRVVDEQAFLDIIDQMRIAVPDEIRQAQRITAERHRMLDQAQEEADRLRADAQREAEKLVAKDTRLQTADAKAQQILAEAHARAEQMKTDADNHCIAVLSALQSEMSSILTTTRNGIQHLQVTTTALKGAESNQGEKGR